MDQAVLVESYVHERPEIGDVGDYARKFHPWFEVFYGMDVIRKSELARRLPRVQARFGEFLEYVVDCRKSRRVADEFLRPDL